jgi:predicted RNase H-like HicB family nuclease
MVGEPSVAYRTSGRVRSSMPTGHREIQILVHRDETAGVYWAESVTVPGAFTQGDSMQEIRENMAEAFGLLVEDDHPEITDYTLVYEMRDG